MFSIAQLPPSRVSCGCVIKTCRRGITPSGINISAEKTMQTYYYPTTHIHIPIFVIGVFKSGKLKKIKESIPSPPFLKRWRGDYMGGGGRRPRLPIRLKLNHPPLTRLDFSIFFFLILFAPFSSLFDVHTRIRSAGLSQFVYRVGVNRFVSIV